ncbi:uncharacterized protein PRCAT00003465001 [Priceomyces carsonii]|uniref:uncharacterized protein n=1 Tax=Priceomyces carsonii TaxID=28549 RepID=UPI002ED7CFE0|nr:unnamed protein product [Priceomyces carsonii]
MTITKENYPSTFKGFGVDKAENWNKPKLVEYKAKDMTPTELCVKIECCGLCGSDVHTLKGHWAPLQRDDLVVGHEVVGRVVSVGSQVSEFEIGERVGIGAACNSCHNCVRCKNDNEQYCRKLIHTYNASDWKSDNYVTQGGYANYTIADESFTFHIPENLESVHAAPLMCGGLTVFSPLVRGVGFDAKGKNVGIIGIGGLGHMAIQFAAAIGAEVTAFSRTSSKKEQCLKMGAKYFVATNEDKEWYENYGDKFDMLLNCASSFTDIDYSSFTKVLKVGAVFTTVGAPPVSEMLSFSPFQLILNNLNICGSNIGSKKEAIKMLEIAAEKGIKPWIEEVPISAKACGESLERCDKGDVRYRFVFTDYENAF